jgi:hypothetical protein
VIDDGGGSSATDISGGEGFVVSDEDGVSVELPGVASFEQATRGSMINAIISASILFIVVPFPNLPIVLTPITFV